jgi:hypothetical protein
MEVREMKTCLAMLGALFLVTGCVGSDRGETQGSGGAAGASAAGSGGAAGSAGSSAAGGRAGDGAGGAGGAAGGCVEQTGGAGGFAQPTCDDLDRMTVSNPRLADAGGDGALSPGENFTLSVDLSEVAGVGHNWYPTVAFESDTPGVTISQGTQFYAILACQTLETTAQGSVDNSVAPGTTVTITAQVAALSETCPDAYSIQIPLAVQ